MLLRKTFSTDICAGVQRWRMVVDVDYDTTTACKISSATSRSKFVCSENLSGDVSVPTVIPGIQRSGVLSFCRDFIARGYDWAENTSVPVTVVILREPARHRRRQCPHGVGTAG